MLNGILDYWRYFSASFVLIIASSCAGNSLIEESADANANLGKTEVAQPSFSATSFATALDRHQPLGEVVGAKADDKTSLGSVEPTAEFSAAIKYAQKTNSYALLIWHKGALRLEHYFPPTTSALRPESASMHKTVLGLLIAAAIDDGFIKAADDPVSRYIPEWVGDPRGDIRVLDLLTMTSGLEALSREGGAQSASAKYVFDGQAARETSLSQPLGRTPGESFDYQNLTSQLLLMILEKATGERYTDYLSRRLWKRLGADDAKVWLNEADGFPRGYTGLYARARDWVRVGLLLKDKGVYGGEEIVSAPLIDAMTVPSSANPNYGWQVWLGNVYMPMRTYSIGSPVGVTASEPFAVDDLIYFDGFGGQRVYISRKQDLVIMRSGEVDFQWDDAALPNAVIKALP